MGVVHINKIVMEKYSDTQRDNLNCRHFVSANYYPRLYIYTMRMMLNRNNKKKYRKFCRTEICNSGYDSNIFQSRHSMY